MSGPMNELCKNEKGRERAIGSWGATLLHILQQMTHTGRTGVVVRQGGQGGAGHGLVWFVVRKGDFKSNIIQYITCLAALRRYCWWRHWESWRRLTQAGDW